MNTSAEFRRLALNTPHGLIASGLGSGLAPRAPGTFGSLAAMIPAWLLLQLSPLWQGLIIGVAFAIGVWACQRASHGLGVHDHGGIVWDEFVGLWLALWAAPPLWWVFLAGFVLFRLFDIWKPPPIGWLDRHLHGGFGIMADDVVAGLYAWICLVALLAWLGP